MVWRLVLGLTLTALPAGAAPPAAALLVEPQAVVLVGPRSGQQILVTGRYSDGSLRDLTSLCEWTVENPAVIAVQSHGYLVPLRDGTTTLTARAGGKAARVSVVVKDFTAPRPISFRREVVGVLSAGGCNGIGCHGAPAGKNGFRLSLWGHDPATDYLQLTRDVLGRRSDRLHPDASLVYLKALGRVAHEGGRRFSPDSVPARVLRDWLAEGLRDDPLPVPDPLRTLTVAPSGRVLPADAPRQQLAARAAFADGSAADVTRLTAFVSTDASVARVSATGLVEFHQAGEVTILCRYLGQLVPVRLAYRKLPEGFAWPGPPEHNYVDRHVFAKLRLLGIAPSELCSDEEFVRRVYLDVCGILPTASETRAFLVSKDVDRRARLIDALLARPEYADFWTHRWLDVLRVSRKSVQLEGARAYQAWLGKEVRDDTPFDQVVRAMLTSAGHSYKDAPANFYCVVPTPLEASKDKHYLQKDLAEAAGQLFLGIRLQCARCHNHPYERWTQDDYYGLAAFFTQLKRERVGTPYKKDRPDYRPMTISAELNAPEMTHPDTGKVVPPRFPGGPPLAVPQGKDRREVLADWLTRPDNPFFARALVNRLWYHLHGRGIVEPVDDFRDSNPSANDELLDALARDLVRQGFRVKPVLRTILNSRTYQLSSRANPFNRADTRYFSRAVPGPLPGEVLFDAVCAVTGVPEKFQVFKDVVRGVPKEHADFPLGTRAVQLPVGDVVTLVSGEAGDEWVVFDQHPFMRKFGQPARDVACACAREKGFDRGQALEMMIGPVVTAKLRDPNNRLGRLLAAGRTDAEILDELYLTALSRWPSPATAKAFLGHVAGAADKRQAWEDVLWTILRSQEFIYRH